MNNAVYWNTKVCIVAIVVVGYIIFLFGTCGSIIAQQLSLDQQGQSLLPQRLRYGVFMHGLGALHTGEVSVRSVSDIGAIPSNVSDSVQRFVGSFGGGFTMGLAVDVPLSPHVVLGARAGWAQHWTRFSTLESIIGGDTIGTAPFPVQIEHTLSTVFGAIDIDLLAQYRIGNRFIVSAGGRASLPIVRRFSQSQIVLSPQDIRLTDLSATPRLANDVVNAEISGIQTPLWSGVVGARYELCFDAEKRWLLAPEITASFGFSPLTPSAMWNIHTFRAGVTVQLLGDESEEERLRQLLKEERESRRKSDSAYKAQYAAQYREIAKRKEMEKELVFAKISSVTGVTADAVRFSKPTIKVTTARRRFIIPILSEVFFEGNSAEIPQRYRRFSDAAQTGAFTMGSLSKTTNAVRVYYHILNIVGRRMTDAQDLRITLIGHASQDVVERGSPDLARRRAQEIKNYLLTKWRIASGRITIQAAVDDRVFAGESLNRAENEYSTQEARRVDIVSSLPERTWLVDVDSTRRIITPPVVEFELNMIAGLGWKEWSIEGSYLENTSVSGEYNVAFLAKGVVPPEVYRWNVVRSADSLPKRSGKIEVLLTGTDVVNRDGKAALYTIPVEVQEVPAGENGAEQFMVYAFDYGSSVVNDWSKTTRQVLEQMREALPKTLPEGSRLRLTGYTDSRGAGDVNKRLSQERAGAVAQLLGIEHVEVRGGGVSTVYDNATPEGRFYNRHVVIDVPPN